MKQYLILVTALTQPALFATDKDKVARNYSRLARADILLMNLLSLFIANFLIINNEDMVLASGVSK